MSFLGSALGEKMNLAFSGFVEIFLATHAKKILLNNFIFYGRKGISLPFGRQDFAKTNQDSIIKCLSTYVKSIYWFLMDTSSQNLIPKTCTYIGTCFVSLFKNC